jgi:hypothetical protein
MPTNLYGSNDNFDLKSSHVLPAMIRKFHEVKIKMNLSNFEEVAHQCAIFCMSMTWQML